jgi:predicted ribosomally synthesized peptide with nif11-like leader
MGGQPLSTEGAILLLRRAKADPDFFFSVALIEDRDERLRAIRAEGYDCTAEELAEVFSHPAQAEDRSEDEA